MEYIPHATHFHSSQLGLHTSFFCSSMLSFLDNYKQINSQRRQPNNMNYSFFLFSKLADVCINTSFEYDVLYEYLTLLFEEYENSEFNVNTQGEYECMINFFNNNK